MRPVAIVVTTDTFSARSHIYELRLTPECVCIALAHRFEEFSPCTVCISSLASCVTPFLALTMSKSLYSGTPSVVFFFLFLLLLANNGHGYITPNKPAPLLAMLVHLKCHDHWSHNVVWCNCTLTPWPPHAPPIRNLEAHCGMQMSQLVVGKAWTVCRHACACPYSGAPWWLIKFLVLLIALINS